MKYLGNSSENIMQIDLAEWDLLATCYAIPCDDISLRW